MRKMKRFLSLICVFTLILSLFAGFGTVTVGATDLFDDVASDAWYSEGVEYVYRQGLMNGVGEYDFNPNGALNRAMVATILYRMAGSPAVTTAPAFADVGQGLWYTNAIAWAESNSIVKGYAGGTFRPMQNITREQMATLLYRYAAYAGIETGSSAADLTGIPDYTNISSYALDAMKWCIGAGLINGVAVGGINYLHPQDNATRAQFAVIVMRFCEHIDEEKPSNNIDNKNNDNNGNGSGSDDSSDSDDEDTLLTVKQDGKGDYTTIQAAADDARPGDTVLVYGGTYREEVVLPRGGTSNYKITLKAASGEDVTITGSEIVTGWTRDDVYSIDDDVYCVTIPKDHFDDDARGNYFNPFAEKWASKSRNQPDYFSCGCVYINDTPLSQVWSIETSPNYEGLVDNANTWYAEVDDETGDTTVYANFGDEDPNAAGNVTEINTRKQCITAAWNQGYITIDGITAIHGCGPKTINFAAWGSKPMEGAIATNGGYYWTIKNCEVYGNRGVAIDYGLGSRGYMTENGGEPALYGHHTITNCNVHDNGTNGIMAYRGAYTEIYGCKLANNNALNTGLTSEAYIKNVNTGFGINIHDNYFYSDQDYDTLAIWYDCEGDGSSITNNIFYSAGNNGSGFSNIELENVAGWCLCANNIFVNTGWAYFSADSNIYMVNNLFLDNTKGYTYPSGTNSAGTKDRYPGEWRATNTYGTGGYARVLRAMIPGTLTPICKDGTDGQSHWETVTRFNKTFNNIFYGTGVTCSANTNEPSPEDYIDTYYEFTNLGDGYSYDLWHAVNIEDYQPNATKVYGNEIDYNAYCAGATKVNYQYAAARGYVADEHSVEDGGPCGYEVTGDRDSFTLSLTVNETVLNIDAPAMTGEFMGKAALYDYLGYDFYAPDVDTDFFGNSRDMQNAVVGPFTDLKAGVNTYVCWPKQVD